MRILLKILVGFLCYILGGIYCQMFELHSQLTSPSFFNPLQCYGIDLDSTFHIQGGDGFTVSRSIGEIEGTHDELLNEAQLAAAAEEKEAHSFEIDPSQVYFIISLALVL